MPSRTDCARGHEFVLIISGVTKLSPRVMNALSKAGCIDAIPTIRSGPVCMKFVRAAPSPSDAVLSATRDVLWAGIGVGVLRDANGDLVLQCPLSQTFEGQRDESMVIIRLSLLTARRCRRFVGKLPHRAQSAVLPGEVDAWGGRVGLSSPPPSFLKNKLIITIN